MWKRHRTYQEYKKTEKTRHQPDPGKLIAVATQRQFPEHADELTSMLVGLEAIITIHDLKTNCHIWTNGNYAKILGYEEGEILQFAPEDFHSLIHPYDLGIFMENIDALLNGREHSVSSVHRVRHKKGHWVWMYYKASIVCRDDSGAPEKILGLALDFSPHIQADQQLNELIAENRRLNNDILLRCLTEREKEIIGHLASGLTCKEISILLGISYYTAETHMRNIHQKLGLNNISALVSFAVDAGLRR